VLAGDAAGDEIVRNAASEMDAPARQIGHDFGTGDDEVVHDDESRTQSVDGVFVRLKAVRPRQRAGAAIVARHERAD